MSSSGHPTELSAGLTPAGLLAVLDGCCARICHDLAGPLGTLMGGLESAMEEPGQPDEGLALADEAARALGSQLRLLRAAWSGPEGDLTAPDLLALLDGLGGRHRLRIDFAGLEQKEPLPVDTARVLLNVLMLAAEALPGGGAISVGGSLAQGIVTRIEGRRAGWPAGLAACLADPASTVARLAAERRMQAPLTVLMASAKGLKLSLLMGQDDQPAPLLLQEAA